MKTIFSVLLLIYALHAGAFSKKEKLPLKVLYVGYNPERQMPADVVYYSTAPAVVAKVYQARMADFKVFLESHFEEVKVIDVRDYSPALSDAADVTIMDAGPVKLPADFDRPMILMHAMAPNVGLPIGLKFDWYCQCLEDEALNINTKHEIFNVPNKVKLTMVKQATPASFFNGHEGLTTPKEMPMWRVVKSGASANGKYIIGMVAHGEGFNDSPDAESISGGVCLKNAEAVALGRQGNYFMWGFSASPDYMTDEAKEVFVNVVSYIKKYDHMPAIVKKTQIATRSSIDEQVYRIDEQLYKKAILSRREGNVRMLKLQSDLLKRKAAGEDIGRSNEMFLKMPVTNDVESFESYLKNQAGTALFTKFGTDTKLYRKYFHDNYEYFYPLDGYALQLDEDAQHLGLSNRKAALLEKCIQLLESGKETAMAQRLLERYTMMNYTTAAEWRNWYELNKTSLFYTEAGGFKFIVNTFGKKEMAKTVEVEGPGVNDHSVIPEPTADEPVVISAQFIPLKGKKSGDLIISASILKGWHMYAYVDKDSPFIQTEPLLELPEGAHADKDWEISAASPYPGNKGVFIFEDKASFKIKVNYQDSKPGSVIRCGLFYQTCDETKCLPPAKKMLDIKI